MKSFIDFFRNYPTSTGLLCLIIISNLLSPKHAQTFILAIPKHLFPLFFFYALVMFGYMLFILPKIKQENKEKTTWLVVATNVVILTLFILRENPL